jgi:DNA-binding transcriptional MocR family regulator
MTAMRRFIWEPSIDVDRDSELPPFLQIARSLANDIQRGRLRPRDRLPGSRCLAQRLQVHRNTVLAALAELIAEGWIQTAPGRGTFVTDAIVDGSRRSRLRRVYANRREILAHSLRRTFGDGIEFSVPPGGMALWVRMRMSIDVEEWARRSIQHGVSWYTARRYAFNGEAKPFARFSFAWLDERELPEAVRRLAAARPTGASAGPR